MIKDIWVSLKDNVELKSTNPFFGTLIIVWVTKNWNLIYSIFNFDSTFTLLEKRGFIEAHFLQYPFLETMGCCIFDAFIILILSYLFLNVSRLIINAFEKKVTPLIYQWTDNNSVVLKTVYDALDLERKRLEKRIEEEREAKLKLQEDYEKLEKKNSELSALKFAAIPANNDKEKSKSVGKFADNEKLELIKSNFINSKKDDLFMDIAKKILNGSYIKGERDFCEELTSLGLIEIESSFNGDFKYLFQPLGKELYERLLIERLRS